MVFKAKSAYIFDNNEPKCILSPRLLRIPNSSYKILGYIPDISGHGNHTEETITLENGSEYTPMKAFPIRVMKPVNRDMAINAAEMEAYCLNSAMEVASFSASMARKHRENSKDQEVKEHDAFISWVKEELTKIGY